MSNVTGLSARDTIMTGYNSLTFLLKICTHFLHGVKICMWFGHNHQICFYIFTLSLRYFVDLIILEDFEKAGDLNSLNLLVAYMFILGL